MVRDLIPKSLLDLLIDVDTLFLSMDVQRNKLIAQLLLHRSMDLFESFYIRSNKLKKGLNYAIIMMKKVILHH